MSESAGLAGSCCVLAVARTSSLNEDLGVVRSRAGGVGGRWKAREEWGAGERTVHACDRQLLRASCGTHFQFE